MTSNISVRCYYLLIKHCCCNSVKPCQAADNQNAVVCSDPKFFDFASLRAIAGDEDSEVKGLSLGLMLKLGYSAPALLQVQASLYSLWFDLLQKSPAPDRFLTCIPDALWKPEILRTLSVGWASLSAEVFQTTNEGKV